MIYVLLVKQSTSERVGRIRDEEFDGGRQSFEKRREGEKKKEKLLGRARGHGSVMRKVCARRYEMCVCASRCSLSLSLARSCVGECKRLRISG